jgi:starch phosphorylase
MKDLRIAYFSMEIGLEARIPTYSGGLGVLAGDTLKSAADLCVPVVGVTLLSRGGYFRQELTGNGRQVEHEVVWNPADMMEKLPNQVTVTIEGREVKVGAWRYVVKSLTGGEVPVYFLDTDHEDNLPQDREITARLYGGDEAYRLCQEIVLGMGGVRMLRDLEIPVYKYHLNEGHSALLTLELLRWFRRDVKEVWDERLVWDYEAVRERCIFTTHTPVEAGHDRFSHELASRILGEPVPQEIIREVGGEESLNMTLLALNLSNYVNGVAKKHGEVSRQMFSGYRIHSITNGVHSFSWTADPMKEVYDRHLPGWADEPELFVRVDSVPDDEIWAAHMDSKRRLLALVEERTGERFSEEVLTLGFARRATSYKRADLLFDDIARLAAIGDGRLQVVYAGKAHPRDEPGKDLIEKIIRFGRELAGRVKVVYLPDYDMDSALVLVAGVDLWLNTPLRPMEASGTSGMKAVHNGVPNFSVLDGWWIEGHIEGVTGWSIGPKKEKDGPEGYNGTTDADDLYDKLERVILPLYYHDRPGWIRVMKNAIGKNAYYFNSHRMMRRYVTNAYIRSHHHMAPEGD